MGVGGNNQGWFTKGRGAAGGGGAGLTPLLLGSRLANVLKISCVPSVQSVLRVLAFQPSPAPPICEGLRAPPPPPPFPPFPRLAPQLD